MSERNVTEKTLEYIEKHLEEDLSLDKIAETLNYSKFYMVRAFSKKTGTSIYQYIQRRRLEQAAEKLTETDMPIVRIAYEARYNSQQAFTHAFRQKYFCSPQTYRRKHKSVGGERMAA